MPEAASLLANPLAIIGDEDIVSGFKALGFKVYPLKETDRYKQAVDEVVRDNAAICLVQDDVYDLIKDEISAYKNKATIFIPFVKKGRDILLEDIIRNTRLRATGAF